MKHFTVAPYITVGIQNKKLYIGFGSVQFEEAGAQTIKDYLRLLRYFKTSHSIADAKEQHRDIERVETLIEKLHERRILIEADSYKPRDRFSRQSLFFNMSGMDPIESQKRLAKKKVAIVGCGGIGNQVSVHLATAGVAEFVLCDADTIELSNLSRQILFKEEDAGQSKADILARELKSRISSVVVSTVSQHILHLDQLSFARNCDFVVVSADAGNVVNIVNRFCVENKIPYMNVGYVNDISVWGPLYIPGETGCYACQDIIAHEGEDLEVRGMIRDINKGYQAPSVGPINMISSGLASLDILKFLAGYPEKTQSLNRRMGLWTHNMKLEHQDCSKNPNCSVCGVKK